ncbi:hypothetical protein [Mesorhizobium sp.]|uniref:hypothetical protein n=1 Tax=Mesorhizobium sp. TaxID=1871066 RepID=UPI0025C4FF2F|nr:hypothetical protein [Mesorhizobium sp.]
MLEFYFPYCGVLKRLRSGALGGEMDFFTHGYKRASAKIYLSRFARFSQFAATRCGRMPIHQDVVNRYLCRFTTDSPRIGQHRRWDMHGEWLRSASLLPTQVDDDSDAPLLTSFRLFAQGART